MPVELLLAYDKMTPPTPSGIHLRSGKVRRQHVPALKDTTVVSLSLRLFPIECVI
jgi:hypothetical protein